VTYGWLHTVFSFIKALDKLSITTPLFIASAENDEVVDNQAQHKLASRHKNTLIKQFKGAKHELFFERDDIRQSLLTSLYKFCESVN
jgi:lysophospholipase